MVEGDGCHRVAARHRQQLVGRQMSAKSPNGKFKAGAEAIMKAGGVLLKIEIHGKNMFYFFGKKGAAPSLVVHIHFGMAGAFAVYKDEEPETTANTRLRLETKDGKTPLTAHLSAMTVVHGSPDTLYKSLVAKLGQDPLREDAKASEIVKFCAAAKKPIGGIMMDQSIFCGVGNIYRTEILYEAGIHPNQPANTLTQKEIMHIWALTVKQMQLGFKSGSIWGGKNGSFCYGRDKSVCGGKVTSWEMGGRTVYACAKKQRLEANRKPAIVAAVRAGTAHLGKMVSAVKAENKKRRTGEGLGVQHVALKDDATRRAAAKAKLAKAKAKRAASKKAVKAKPGAKAKAPVAMKRTAMAKAPTAKRRRS
eukprot:TRINITY_DN9056_c0_g2_i3.p1 TRINITY_DN9056_c0_g2~~TRINITY_DN9056_c0_g2_i3.p1  ORF type:complete len:364 (+),score=77.80 TRINITY_DN9056_c0_g2_i3:89-1180(+)